MGVFRLLDRGFRRGVCHNPVSRELPDISARCRLYIQVEEELFESSSTFSVLSVVYSQLFSEASRAFNDLTKLNFILLDSNETKHAVVVQFAQFLGECRTFGL